MFTYTTNGTEKTTLIKNIDFISCVDQAGEKLSKIFPIEDLKNISMKLILEHEMNACYF